MGLILRVLAMTMLFASPFTVMAQEKTGVRDGFQLSPGTARILLLEPSVRVGEQSTGGMFEPNADWTDEARENVERELTRVQGTLGNEIVRLEFDGSPQTVPLQKYHALFGAVAGSVIEYQFFVGNRLPTKKMEKSFSWSVGPDIRNIAVLKGFDYILLIRTKDAYGSTGRKILHDFGFAVKGSHDRHRAIRRCTGTGSEPLCHFLLQHESRGRQVQTPFLIDPAQERF